MKVPQISEARVREILKAGGVGPDEVVALAVRGYWKKSMGNEKRNDTGIFDDAWILVGPGGLFAPLQANTDPSRIGWNDSIGKPFAMLQPGLWRFYIGAHKGRTPAFRQADDAATAKKYGIPNGGKFRVWRAKSMDEVIAGTAKSEEGYFNINIHDSASDDDERTSSWGCLTSKKSWFVPWATKAQKAMRDAVQKNFPVLLVNGPVN